MRPTNLPSIRSCRSLYADVLLFVSFVAYVLFGLVAFYRIDFVGDQNRIPLAWQIVIAAAVMVASQVLLYLAIRALT